MLEQSGPSNGKTSILREVAGLNGIKVVNVAAGAEHSALVTGNCVMIAESGEIMTWGWGEHGQLGLGDSCDQTIPQSVSLGDGFRDNHNQTRVYCGSGFTYGVRSNFSIS
ncbi:hypothetical protein GIB67_029220 [Kingdonia uniflora]|uniref:Uncharacterized protein n=1 Tax=Kingdonia uniflora TaxID=39325 RepID=A0A7J7NB16_9MAGN|nr:hypothetical protein GIB67_029220 [Kingdonia uniflora]